MPTDLPVPDTPRIGIVGAGRTRQGLGPYLAAAFTQAGCRVVGVAGRDRASAGRAAAGLERDLGYPVQAFDDAAALAQCVDALVVAAPVPGHLAGLDAALAHGVPCLCEKPLVGWRDAAAGAVRLAAFRARGLLVAENCQWPFALPALRALHPGFGEPPVRQVVMGLGPAWPGPAMVEDSLSHVLSVVQALAALGPEAAVDGVAQQDPGPAAVRNKVRFRIAGRGGPVDVSLHLQHTPEPPRPAWIEVDGWRAERRIGAGYAQSFVAPDGRAVDVRDPLRQLVYGFVADLKAKNGERNQSLVDDIAVRLRLYAAVCGALTTS